MKLKNLIVLSVLFNIILCSGIVAAADFFATRGIDYNVSIPCNFGGYFCNPAVNCNASLIYNNSTLVYQNLMRNASGNYVIFPVTGSQISKNGEYFGDVKCTDPLTGRNSSTNYVLRVTNTGEEFSESQASFYGIVAFISIFIFLLLLYGAIQVPWADPKGENGEIIAFNRMKYFKLFCIVMAYVFMVWISFLVYNLSLAYESFAVASGFFNTLYIFLLVLMFPIIVLSFIIAVVQFVRGKELQSAIDRGISFNG